MDRPTSGFMRDEKLRTRPMTLTYRMGEKPKSPYLGENSTSTREDDPGVVEGRW